MKKQNKETKKVAVKVDIKEEKTMNAFEVLTPVLKGNKQIINELVGQAYMTQKRVAIPKWLYTVLTKEERDALRMILDSAQERKELK